MFIVVIVRQHRSDVQDIPNSSNSEINQSDARVQSIEYFNAFDDCESVSQLVL